MNEGAASQPGGDSEPSGDRTFTVPVIEAFLATGECETVEFKSSLRYDYAKSAVNKDLTKAVVKELAGFLNTYGGTVLIGVSDNGEILGIQLDIDTLTRASTDGWELALRTAITTHLGAAVGPHIQVQFVPIEAQVVACVSCDPHPKPVFLDDGVKRDFYVRDGNRTQPLDVRSTHEWIDEHWPRSNAELTATDIKALVLDALSERGIIRAADSRGEALPPWITVATRRVVDLFLQTLQRSRAWQRLYIVSPWISEFGEPATLTFDALLKRLVNHGTTAYVVTRPPTEPWHVRALERLEETGRANIALLPDLHVKLFTAHTTDSTFALLGSANLTQQSLVNREIGVLVNSYGDGRQVVKELDYEAAQIYRSPGRSLKAKAAFAP
jgi:hypothetical protein